MKKIYSLLFCAATFLSVAKAQTNTDLQFQKGDKLLGGNIGLGSAKSSGLPGESNNFTFNINPTYSFFTKPNRLIGFELGFAYNRSKNTINSKYQAYNFSAGVFKQYWLNLGKRFYFVTEGNLSAGYGYGVNSDSVRSDITSRSYGASFKIVPGIAYRPSKHILIDLHFSNFLVASYSHTKSAGVATSDQFGLNAGFANFSTENLQFGFRYIL